MPAVSEYRSYGLGSLLAGLVFGVFAVVIEPVLISLFLIVLFAVFFGIAMYVFVLRRMGRRALAEPTVLSACERESAEAMRRRVVQMLALQSAGMVVVVAIGSVQGIPAAPFGSGAFLGMGAAMLVMSRWFRRWEEERSVRLLRMPHYRWHRDPQAGQRGGGIMDPRNIYVMARP